MFNFFSPHQKKKKYWRDDFYLSFLKTLAVLAIIVQRQKYDLESVTERIEKGFLNVPVIFEKRRDIIHDSCKKTCHSFLLIASKHHVQHWSEHLCQYAQSLGTIATCITSCVTAGRCRRCHRRLGFRHFRHFGIYVAWLVRTDFLLWNNSQGTSEPGSVFQRRSCHGVTRLHQTLSDVLAIRKMKKKRCFSIH